MTSTARPTTGIPAWYLTAARSIRAAVEYRHFGFERGVSAVEELGRMIQEDADIAPRWRVEA